jgi:hypothetical protein
LCIIDIFAGGKCMNSPKILIFTMNNVLTQKFEYLILISNFEFEICFNPPNNLLLKR